MVSRIYGLFVKDPLRMDYTFDPETGEVKQAGIYGLDNYEEDKKKKFNPVLYQWGVWCASWARAEILGVIGKLGQIGTEDKPGIRWNRRVLYRCFALCDRHGGCIRNRRVSLEHRILHFREGILLRKA